MKYKNFGEFLIVMMTCVFLLIARLKDRLGGKRYEA